MPKASEFKALHIKGDPVILYNIWDAGSAAIVAQAGAKALATGSMPVALAMGYEDGEKLPINEALENIQRILAASDLPVSMDLEGGYGVAAEQVAETIQRACDLGISGFNFEDQIIGNKELYNIEDQVFRVAAARNAAGGAFLNARTDLFLKAPVETHDRALLAQAVERAKRYEQAGANGFFAPGLADAALIGELCEQVALPVNILALPHVPDNKALAELGVARISYGPVPYRAMAAWLAEQAAAVFNAPNK